MKRELFLIHWNAAEAEELARPLRLDGWHVEIEGKDGTRGSKLIRENPPEAVVIYLTRLPSHGRETASYLRSLKATRSVPIVFVDGREDVVERTKRKVPDAVYTASAELLTVLTRYAAAGTR